MSVAATLADDVGRREGVREAVQATYMFGEESVCPSGLTVERVVATAAAHTRAARGS